MLELKKSSTGKEITAVMFVREEVGKKKKEGVVWLSITSSCKFRDGRGGVEKERRSLESERRGELSDGGLWLAA